MRAFIGPFAMGCAMGGMMLWMLHGALASGSQVGLTALAGFIGAHVGLAALAISLAVWGARLSPVWRARLRRLHRPRLSHLKAMAIGVMMVGGFVHLIVHAGGASWT